MNSMDQDNTKAIQLLGKVITKLQELVKELETPTAPPAPPQNQGFFASMFGTSKTDPPKVGGKPSKKHTKKVKGGADINMDTKASMVYNTSDLLGGVSSTVPNVMNNGQVMSLQHMPQPFSSGNSFSVVSSLEKTIDHDDYNLASPSITSGGAKKKSRKQRK